MCLPGSDVPTRKSAKLVNMMSAAPSAHTLWSNRPGTVTGIDEVAVWWGEGQWSVAAERRRHERNAPPVMRGQAVEHDWACNHT